MANSMSTKTRHTLLSGSALAVAAILALGLLALSQILLSGARIDLTENQQYTLASGTLSVLDNLSEPIDVYFFYSSDQAQGIPQITNYATRVRELLIEMASRADGNIRLQFIDPEPFSEDEDRAVSLGIEAVPLNQQGSNLYFGLAASNSVDETQVIPFFQMDHEPLLEYDLAKLFYQLNQSSKPVVGLLSTLKMSGEINPMQRRRTEPWLIVAQLKEFFEVRDLDYATTSIPDDVDVLMIVHPAHFSDQTLYAIDQFALRGGRVLLFMDSYASIAVPSNDPLADSGLSTISDIGNLLSSWGVELVDKKIVGDFEHALQVQVQQDKPPVHHLAMLGLNGDAMNREDVITREMQSLNMGFAGAVRPLESATTQFTPLLQTSQRADLIDAHRIQPGMDPAVLLIGFEPTGERYALAARVTGKISTAFPNGAPEGSEATGEPLTESSRDLQLIIVADTDLLMDRMWAQSRNIGGQRFVTPWAGNADFVIGTIDNLLGSDDLINIRPRASFARPFEVVAELKRQADSRFQAKQEELQQQLRVAESRMNEIFAQQESAGDSGDGAIIDQQLKETLASIQNERLRIRKELRQVLHNRDAEIDRLGTTIKFLNIFLVPLLLCLIALLVAALRRRRNRMART